MELNLSSKIPQKYSCEYCNYFTCYSKDYKKHLLTKKHKERNGNIQEITKVLICNNCEKEFKTNAGLWKHKQKCNQQQKETDEPSDKDLIFKILKQNSELIKENSELRKEQTDIKELILKFKG